MKKIEWKEPHALVFNELIQCLNKSGLKYFILRNYHGLPEINDSKDVDIIIEPGYYNKSAEILKEIYESNNILYRVVKYERVRCWYGYNIDREFSIHIDLIEGYLNKGFEIFKFEDLYSNTVAYKDFRVLSVHYDVIVLLYYKLIATKQLNQKYRHYISSQYHSHKNLINDIIYKTIGSELAKKLILDLGDKNFDKIVGYSKELSTSSKIKAFTKRPFKVIYDVLYFIFDKFNRIVICTKKYRNMIAVEGADGTGKTTFINGLIEDIDFYFNSDSYKSKVYHFRPTILPNLGAVGEKAGVMKEDKDFTNPHRRKPADPVSSFIRMVYYWLDYVLGVPVIVRKNAQFDNFTIFDRYIYDFIVDPYRSRINLPYFVRKTFSKLVINPRVVFVLLAEPEVIYARKQELTLVEIKRQVIEFRKLAESSSYFYIIDAGQSPEVMVKQAMEIILKEFSTN
ncbi:hypothetical protein GVN20_26010 [Runella sp. CRIBMP]|uniref:hypothetical protein n=1 Tax=Runella sp. CRIBMP TaxID=2683261 RepID=UPI00141290EF|nr:hypothetical protein [Runella sp. CRIBMP]NBB22838.1 hypothetical protein [Runella sp. CRIBMP]